MTHGSRGPRESRQSRTTGSTVGALLRSKIYPCIIPFMYYLTNSDHYSISTATTTTNTTIEVESLASQPGHFSLDLTIISTILLLLVPTPLVSHQQQEKEELAIKVITEALWRDLLSAKKMKPCMKLYGD